MVTDRVRTVSLVRDWLNYLTVSKALAPRTVALYGRLCSWFVDECVQDRRLEEITPAEIEAWLQRPRDGRAHGRTGAPARLHRDASTMRASTVGCKQSGRSARTRRTSFATDH